MLSSMRTWRDIASLTLLGCALSATAFAVVPEWPGMYDPTVVNPGGMDTEKG